MESTEENESGSESQGSNGLEENKSPNQSESPKSVKTPKKQKSPKEKSGSPEEKPKVKKEKKTPTQSTKTKGPMEKFMASNNMMQSFVKKEKNDGQEDKKDLKGVNDTDDTNPHTLVPGMYYFKCMITIFCLFIIFLCNLHVKLLLSYYTDVLCSVQTQ